MTATNNLRKCAMILTVNLKAICFLLIFNFRDRNEERVRNRNTGRSLCPLALSLRRPAVSQPHGSQASERDTEQQAASSAGFSLYVTERFSYGFSDSLFVSIFGNLIIMCFGVS